MKDDEKGIEGKKKLQTEENSLKHKCIVCGSQASLELDNNQFICEECAMIQSELAQN